MHAGKRHLQVPGRKTLYDCLDVVALSNTGMTFEFPAITEFGIEHAAEVLTRGFSDYIVKIPFSATGLVQMARADSIDLTASRMVVRAGTPIGAALVARRGWTCRLAGMAIVPEGRRSGAGRALMTQILAEGRARGERTMVLEVLEQNELAVGLYESMGFTKIRRLVSFAGPGLPDAAMVPELSECDPREMAAVVTREGLTDLPWQLSGETLAQLTPPSVAYWLAGAWVALTNVTGSTVTIRGLVTERGQQGKGRALALLRAVMARHPGKEWRVSAVWPEELSTVFGHAGLSPAPLSQWQMSRSLPA